MADESSTPPASRRRFLEVATLALGGAVGSLAGLGRDDAYRCKLRVEKRSGKVQVGDLIVTKNLGAFPGGINVGVVWAPSIWCAKLVPDGRHANHTTSQRETDLGGGACFNDARVEVERA